MNIATNRDGALHRLHVPLFHQNRPRLIAQYLHLRLRQRLALHQLLDLTLQICVRRHRFDLIRIDYSLKLSNAFFRLGFGSEARGVERTVLVGFCLSIIHSPAMLRIFSFSSFLFRLCVSHSDNDKNKKQTTYLFFFLKN